MKNVKKMANSLYLGTLLFLSSLAVVYILSISFGVLIIGFTDTNYPGDFMLWVRDNLKSAVSLLIFSAVVFVLAYRNEKDISVLIENCKVSKWIDKMLDLND